MTPPGTPGLAPSHVSGGARPDRVETHTTGRAPAGQSPGLELRWTVRQGVEELYGAFKEHGLAADDLTGPRFQRIAQIRALMDRGRLDADLRWRAQLQHRT